MICLEVKKFPLHLHNLFGYDNYHEVGIINLFVLPTLTFMSLMVCYFGFLLVN
jgi:hypothetical protein